MGVNMLLRNKKTGEIMDLECITIFDRPDKYNTGDAIDEYYSLADLNNEWEDYVPKEPLIKDEKIRKAVRAWAEANRVAEARYSSCHDAECEFNARDDENKSIVFIGNFTEMNKELDYSGRTIYTIDKLCGELHNDANM